MVVRNIEKLLKPALLSAAVFSLSGCAYGLGGGYADGYYGDGYVNGGYASGYSSGYACDPYDPYDVYYSCDYGYGFANIGFGGGWYDNFYYPGYGLFVFDRGGHRHGMKNHHRRHWAKRRAEHGTRGQRGRNLTPEQRAERRERRANMTPEERAERRERRQERRARRGSGVKGTDGGATGAMPTGRSAVRQGRGNGNNAGARRRAGPSSVVRAPRMARPSAATEQAQRSRPARVSRPARQQARPQRAARPQTSRPAPRAARPTPRPAPRSNRSSSTRRKID